MAVVSFAPDPAKLTAINDNALITYLATLVPDLPASARLPIAFKTSCACPCSYGGSAKMTWYGGSGTGDARRMPSAL